MTASETASTDSSATRPGWLVGAAAVVALLIALAALLIWQTQNGLSHIDLMMAERSETLERMITTELRNVARYGKARRARLDEVLADVAASSDVLGVSLEGRDNGLRLAHGELPRELPPGLSAGRGYQLEGATLLRGGPMRIETHHCQACQTCKTGCQAGGGQHIDGEYLVVLAIDAHPYLVLRRMVWAQSAAGGALLVLLAFGLWLFQRQLQRSWSMRQALAVADERARSFERLGRLSAGLAHEIKNPVGSLRGFAQLIAEECEEGSPQREYAELMVGELDVITRRVNRMRELARPTPPQLLPLDPTAILRRVAALLAPDLAARSLRLELELPGPSELVAQIDEDRFRDVVVNLVINAIEASPEGGVIRVALNKETGDTLTLEVADQGPGIALVDRERALRPFHSTKPGGMGLGLAVAQQAIEDHGGTLEIDDAEGGGALLRARGIKGREAPRDH